MRKLCWPITALVLQPSLSPEGNITTTTDVLKIVGGVVNTCPAVLQLAFAAAAAADFSFAHFNFGMLESPENQDIQKSLKSSQMLVCQEP